LAYHLLKTDPEKVRGFAQSILDARQRIRLCKECYNFTETESCSICANSNRNSQVICVVEKQSDIPAFENSGFFNGKYHVLGGVISPLDGVGPDRLHIPELVNRVLQSQTQEVILALGSGADAEATALFIDHSLAKTTAKRTRLARGIPMGSDLDYIDELTMMRAFEARTLF
jgi:recombination protein RecR